MPDDGRGSEEGAGGGGAPVGPAGSGVGDARVEFRRDGGDKAAAREGEELQGVARDNAQQEAEGEEVDGDDGGQELIAARYGVAGDWGAIEPVRIATALCPRDGTEALAVGARAVFTPAADGTRRKTDSPSVLILDRTFRDQRKEAMRALRELADGPDRADAAA